MKQITQLLPEDLRKELYELWEVSRDTRLFFFTVTEFIWLIRALVGKVILMVSILLFCPPAATEIFPC